MALLDGKVVLVTGAKGGLGTFVTQAFLDAGATVAGTSRSIKQSDFPDQRFTAFAAELNDSAAAERLVASVVERFQKIDALVHLVGGFAGGQAVSETSEETLDMMLEMNVKSAFRIVRAVLPQMQSRGSGRIVAVGSKAALEPAANTGAYSLSKAALVSLMRTVAIENKSRGITANVLLPSTMDTPANRAMAPQADPGQWVPPGDVASLAVWLVSSAGAAVNGVAIPIYGRDL